MKEKNFCALAILGLLFLVICFGLNLTQKSNDEIAQTLSTTPPQISEELVAELSVSDSLPADIPVPGEVHIQDEFFITVFRTYNYDNPSRPFIELEESYDGLERQYQYLFHYDEEQNLIVEDGDRNVNLGKVKFYDHNTEMTLAASQNE